jgi:hypothetical protein
MIDKQLLSILACPLCKSSVQLKENKLWCTNKQCGCIYRIDDDIPVMLIPEAERPCPKCGTQRQWLGEKDILRCPYCGETYRYARE